MRALRQRAGTKLPRQRADTQGDTFPDMLKLESNMAYRLSLLNFLVNKATARIYGAGGLSTHQWKVMSVLNTYEPMTALDIAQWVTLDKAAISRAIQLLLRQGLVERSLRANDARMVDVRMTREGRRVCADVGGKLAALQAALLQDVTEEQERTLFEVLKRVESKVRSLPSQ